MAKPYEICRMTADQVTGQYHKIFLTQGSSQLLIISFTLFYIFSRNDTYIYKFRFPKCQWQWRQKLTHFVLNGWNWLVKQYRYIFFYHFFLYRWRQGKLSKYCHRSQWKTATHLSLTMLTHVRIQKKLKSLKNSRVASVTVTVSTTQQTMPLTQVRTKVVNFSANFQEKKVRSTIKCNNHTKENRFMKETWNHQRNNTLLF